MRIFFVFIYLLFGITFGSGQVNFTKSNLPIILINTNGQQIQDEPKIMADMKIIYNGPNIENKITDVANEYNNKIGIELRGSTSQGFPKKPYGFETWNTIGDDNEVKLLGMPKETDWTLNASYNDKSLMRDGLAYMFAGDIMEYAPRVRYTELAINNDYQGIYLLIEKIKRDKERVDIAKMEKTDITGDALTGGYIIKIDKESGSNSGEGWNSLYKPYNGAWQNTFFQFEYPKAKDITIQQKEYIRNHINKVENSIASPNFKDPVNGYRKYIDTKSLMDYIIINELTKNVDAYRLSTFFYKERDSDGGKIKFGPVWDFNLGFGNADYCTQGNPEGLVILNFNEVCSEDWWVVHFWWKKFLQDETFYDELKYRWKALRKKEFIEERINFVIDSISTLLGEAQVRNFQKWPVLGEYVWPNYYVGKTYGEEVNYLKGWIKNRITYLDRVWEIKDSNLVDTDNEFLTLSPNPANNTVILDFKDKIPSDIKIQGYDTSGRQFFLPRSIVSDQKLEIDVRELPLGLVIINVTSSGKTFAYKLIKE
jgi:hypothetical protein